MPNLGLPNVQTHALWTLVQKEQARLSLAERSSGSLGDDPYTFVAINAGTRLIPHRDAKRPNLAISTAC
jgi:hypothetical protein